MQGGAPGTCHLLRHWTFFMENLKTQNQTWVPIVDNICIYIYTCIIYSIEWIGKVPIHRSQPSTPNDSSPVQTSFRKTALTKATVEASWNLYWTANFKISIASRRVGFLIEISPCFTEPGTPGNHEVPFSITTRVWKTEPWGHECPGSSHDSHEFHLPLRNDFQKLLSWDCIRSPKAALLRALICWSSLRQQIQHGNGWQRPYGSPVSTGRCQKYQIAADVGSIIAHRSSVTVNRQVLSARALPLKKQGPGGNQTSPIASSIKASKYAA